MNLDYWVTCVCQKGGDMDSLEAPDSQHSNWGGERGSLQDDLHPLGGQGLGVIQVHIIL